VRTDRASLWSGLSEEKLRERRLVRGAEAGGVSEGVGVGDVEVLRRGE